MVTVGNNSPAVRATQGVEQAIIGLATTDIELVVSMNGIGPPGPQGPVGHSVVVYTQAVAPTVGLYPGDIWVKSPPVVTPQPSYLWDGTAWVQQSADATVLNALGDVTIVAPVLGHVLRFNGTEFVNVLGSTYFQPADADLTSIAALTSAPDMMLYATGAQSWALTAITDVGRTLLSAATVNAMRTYLDVWSRAEIGDPETDFVAIFNTALLG